MCVYVDILQIQHVKQKKRTFSIGGNSFEETAGGAPSGTLTQLRKPASSIASLSISPSTYSVESNSINWAWSNT